MDYGMVDGVLPLDIKQLSPGESRDSREKELIGQQWSKASEGKAVFVMATMERGDPKEVRSQVMDALSH